MTQAEEFVKNKYGVPVEALKLNTQEVFHLMNNFAYETLKELLKSVKEIENRNTSQEIKDIIISTINFEKQKFHQV